MENACDVMPLNEARDEVLEVASTRTFPVYTSLL